MIEQELRKARSRLAHARRQLRTSKKYEVILRAQGRIPELLRTIQFLKNLL